jgi:hypothetical protein
VFDCGRVALGEAELRVTIEVVPLLQDIDFDTKTLYVRAKNRQWATLPSEPNFPSARRTCFQMPAFLFNRIGLSPFSVGLFGARKSVSIDLQKAA